MNVRALSLAAALAATATFAACADQPTSPAIADQLSEQSVAGKNDKAKKDKARAALLTDVPVSGVLSDGGSFTGTFTAQRFAIDEATRTLSITGMITGTAIDASGTSTAISQVVSAPATLARAASTAMRETGMMHTVAMRATCDVLFLDLGPLSLDLLGLTVDLSQIVLDVNAVSGAGNLLGNLLCAVVGLLDGFGLLASITQLLDSINAILSGLGGLGGLVNMTSPVANVGFQVHT